MMEHLERLHAKDGFEFHAAEARLRCVPHTIHLAALEVSCFGFKTVIDSTHRQSDSCYNVSEPSKMTRRRKVVLRLLTKIL